MTSIDAGPVRELDLHDELTAVVDDRTRAILERRRRTGIVRRRGWLVRRMLFAADVSGLFAALLLAEWLVSRRENAGLLNAYGEVLAFSLSVPGWIVVAKLYGLYERDEERTDHSTTDDFGGVFHMVTVCTWAFWAITHLVGHAHPTWPKLLIFWAAAIGFVTVGRAVARAISRRNIAYIQNALIVGAGDVGQLIARKLLQHPEYGINVVGFIDDEPKARHDGLEHLALLGGVDRLAAAIRLFDVERVIVAFSNEPHDDTLHLIRGLKTSDLQIDIVPRLFEMVGPRAGMHMIEGLPLVGLPPLRLSRSSALLKRALDASLALIGIVALAPALLAIALAVKLDSAGPVLYRHNRLGRGGRSIEVWKFRSMLLSACRGDRYGGEGAESLFAELLSDPVRAREFDESYKLSGDPRVTRIGRFLRRSSLDELPQLFNVLVGDLSLVGPRAITADELPRYGDAATDLLAIKPGVTGYWQINGRSRLGYEDRVRLDLSYIASWSLRLDLEILAKTLRVLASRAGAS